MSLFIGFRFTGEHRAIAEHLLAIPLLQMAVAIFRLTFVLAKNTLESTGVLILNAIAGWARQMMNRR
jgi:hypothetical protein